MKLKYATVARAMGRIWEIEAKLGHEKSDPILSLKAVNQKCAELEKEMAAMPAPKPATPPAAASVKVTVAAAPSPVFNRQQCEAIMGAVFHESRMTFAELSDAALLEDTVARVAAAKLTCPGVQSPGAIERLSGTPAIFRGIRQDALNRTLAEFKNHRK